MTMIPNKKTCCLAVYDINNIFEISFKSLTKNEAYLKALSILDLVLMNSEVPEYYSIPGINEIFKFNDLFDIFWNNKNLIPFKEGLWIE